MPVSTETLQAFDRAAPGYAAGWGAHPLARVLRARVLAAGARRWKAGDRVLDLGCGPGLDAAVLEGLGLRVTAVDASAGMVAEAARRARDARVLPLELLAELEPEGPFDGALSNFGALNCLSDLPAFGGALARVLRPGAFAMLVVINDRCPAEDLALLARARRPRRRGGVVEMEGARVPIRYLGTRALVAALPAFALVHREALGALVPPPDLGGRHGLRARAEPWVAAWPGIRALGDHTLVVMQRRA